MLDFIIVDTPASPVIGLKACLSPSRSDQVLPLSDVTSSPDTFKQKYADVFQGLGCFPGEHKFQLDKNLSPIVHPHAESHMP